MFNLVAARKAGCDDHVSFVAVSNRWEETAFADSFGNIVVFLLIAKRSGHSATATIKVHDLATGDEG